MNATMHVLVGMLYVLIALVACAVVIRVVRAFTRRNKCRWCGQEHEGVCPRVRAYQYTRWGTLRRVEFWRRS